MQELYLNFEESIQERIDAIKLATNPISDMLLYKLLEDVYTGYQFFEFNKFNLNLRNSIIIKDLLNEYKFKPIFRKEGTIIRRVGQIYTYPKELYTNTLTEHRNIAYNIIESSNFKRCYEVCRLFEIRHKIINSFANKANEAPFKQEHYLEASKNYKKLFMQQSPGM